MSASWRGADPHDLPELHERERVGDLQRVLRVLLDEQHRGACVAQLEDRLHHRLGREGREPERGLVGDEHLRRVGERGRQAQHLLLATGEEAGNLLPSLRQDREPLVGLVAQLRVAQQHRDVLLDGEAREDAARFGHEEQAAPRALVRRRVGDVGAVEQDRCRPSRRRVPRRPSTASTSRRRSPRAGPRPCRARARATRRGGPPHRRSRRRSRSAPGRPARAGRRSVNGLRRSARRPCAALRARERCRRGRPPRRRRCSRSRSFSRFFRSRCWPTSERMPSGSCASWMAPIPDRIGTK